MMTVYSGGEIFFLVFFYFLLLDAEKVMQMSFCDLHSAVDLADIMQSSRQKYRPFFSINSTRPTEVGNFINRLTSL